jgi:hypothetical protein
MTDATLTGVDGSAITCALATARKVIGAIHAAAALRISGHPQGWQAGAA